MLYIKKDTQLDHVHSFEKITLDKSTLFSNHSIKRVEHAEEYVHVTYMGQTYRTLATNVIWPSEE